MGTWLRIITLGVIVVLIAHRSPALSPQTPSQSDASCSQPVTLELMTGAGGQVSYRLATKLYPGYPLDELRKLLSACQTSRPLYVLLDNDVPIGEISSAVAPKLQVENVRYFIRYQENKHLIVELKITGYDSKLP
jgi:hypothetical protein